MYIAGNLWTVDTKCYMRIDFIYEKMLLKKLFTILYYIFLKRVKLSEEGMSSIPYTLFYLKMREH